MNYFFSLLSLLFISIQSHAQNFFNKELINCTVELSKTDSLNRLISHGTGFLLYDYGGEGTTIVATCAHQLKNSHIVLKISVTDSAIIFLKKYKYESLLIDNRFWFFDGNSLYTKFDLVKDKTFVSDESKDIALFRIDLPDYITFRDSTTIKVTNTASIPRSLIAKKQDVDLGTSSYFIGFPFGIGSLGGFRGEGEYSDRKMNPVIRTGILAWKSESTQEFLLDAFSYGGNSGSPVFSQRGELSGEAPKLFGMVLGHLSDPIYRDKIDINYGLARCVWVDEIVALISKLN